MRVAIGVLSQGGLGGRRAGAESSPHLKRAPPGGSRPAGGIDRCAPRASLPQGLPRERPVFRFAPSPNGLLHLGHAYSALLNADLARRTGGRLLLRIEEIPDGARSRRTFEEAIGRYLAWLGLSWETPVRRQSEHFLDGIAALPATCGCAGCFIPASARARPSPRRSPDLEADKGRSWPRDPDGAPPDPRTLPDARRSPEIPRTASPPESRMPGASMRRGP